MAQLELAPSNIRFMHDCISKRFSDGRSVNGTINDITCGYMSVHDIPRIRVVCKDGNYYSFDNRRLYVYRVLHCRGLLNTVTVKLASMKLFQPQKFTTKNNGQTVVVKRDITYEHNISQADNNFNGISFYQEDSDDSDDDEQSKNDNTATIESFATDNLGQLQRLRLTADAEQRCKSDKQEKSLSSCTTSSERNAYFSTHNSNSIPNACNHSGITWRSTNNENWLSSTNSLQSDVNRVPSSSLTHENYTSNQQNSISSYTWSNIAQSEGQFSFKNLRKSSSNNVSNNCVVQMNNSTYAEEDSSVTWDRNTLIVTWHSFGNPVKSGDTCDSSSCVWQKGSSINLATSSQTSHSTNEEIKKNDSNRASLESTSTGPFVGISDLCKNRFRSVSPPISNDQSLCIIM